MGTTRKPSVRMNFTEVGDALNGLPGILDLTRDNLGDDLLDIAADGIRSRTLAGQSSNGAPLAANKGDYGKRKRSKGIPVGVGLKHDGPQMLSAGQIKGTSKVTPASAKMTPGTSAKGRLKAERFESGSGKLQPARPFYDLDPATEEKIQAAIGEALEDRIEEL